MNGTSGLSKEKMSSTPERAAPFMCFVPESASLVEETERVVANIPLADYLRYGCDLLPEESIEPDEEIIEEVDIEIPLNGKLPERLAEAGVELSESERDRLRTLIQDGVPVRSKQPDLRADCARVLAAEVVVINMHAEEERPAGSGDSRADPRPLQELVSPVSNSFPLPRDPPGHLSGESPRRRRPRATEGHCPDQAQAPGALMLGGSAAARRRSRAQLCIVRVVRAKMQFWRLCGILADRLCSLRGDL